MVVVTDIKLKKIAAYLGLLQGATWAILSLICICVSFTNNNYYNNNHLPNTYMGVVNRIWFMFYLTGDYHSAFPNQIMRPRVFLYFMWAYLLLNVLWFVASLRILKVQGSLATIKKLKKWSAVTAVICVLDFLMVILLSADYQKCLNFSNKITVQETCSLGILPVLVIAAKGFTLWVVNAIFVKVILDLTKELQTHNYSAIHNLAVPNAQTPQTVIQTNVEYVPQYQQQRSSLPPPYENHQEFKNNSANLN